MQRDLVERERWIDREEYVRGLALAQLAPGPLAAQLAIYLGWVRARVLGATLVALTPGPVVITVAFIGYLVGGPVGATAAAIGVFVPCYLFVIIPAPYYHRVAGNRSIKAFVDGVSAAAAGAIGGAAIVLGRRSIVDAPTIAIAAVTIAVLTYVKKVPEPLVIAAAGLVGLVVST